jgi:VWFA-related protein
LPDKSKTVSCLALIFGIIFFSAYLRQSPAGSKGTNPKNASSQNGRFNISVHAVMINANATDKEGNPVTDLTVGDFKIYDNDVPQNITTFAMESFGPPEVEMPEKDASNAKSTTQEYKNAQPRMISLVIDDLTMESVLDFPRVVDAIKNFVKTNMGPMDQVSIVSGSRIVQYPFTNDKKRLLEQLETVPNRLNKSTNFYYASDVGDEAFSSAFKDSYSNYMSDFKARDIIAKRCPPDLRYLRALRIKEEGAFRTQDLLYTLRQNIRVLKHFEGNRLIVLFSDGFPAEQREAEAYTLQEVLDMAVREGIIMNAVSTRSIYVKGKSADNKKVLGVCAPDTEADDEFDRIIQHASLTRMAEETGGQFFADNRIYDHIKAIASRRSSNYILTYNMPSDKPSEDYHKIKLEIARPGVHLSYRKGYYSPKEDPSFDNNKKEDILAAINHPMNLNEIPVKLSYNYAQQEGSNYGISFIINADIRNIKFMQEGDRRINQVSFVVAVFDEADRYVRGLERLVEFRLQESSYKDLYQHGLISKFEFRLPMADTALRR